MIYIPTPTEIILPSCYFVLFILHFVNKKLSVHLDLHDTASLEENLSFLFLFFDFYFSVNVY